MSERKKETETRTQRVGGEEEKDEKKREKVDERRRAERDLRERSAGKRVRSSTEREHGGMKS